MDRCDVSGQLRINRNYYFQAWNISQHWPEDQCTYEVCSLICTWIEERAVELLAATDHYENDYEAALYMIGLAVHDLYARRIINLVDN